MDIKIGRSAHVCAKCECDFVHEQGIHSIVLVDEEGFVREDYCGDCRENTESRKPYSTWNAQYYDPKVAEQNPEESYSPLRQTFYEAVEDKTREGLSVAYLSAQLLRRQKVFRLIKETKDPDTDASVILFNDRIGNRLIEVNDPNLSHAELDGARVRLMESLAILETPAEEPTDEASETSDEKLSEETETESTESMESTENVDTQDIAQV